MNDCLIWRFRMNFRSRKLRLLAVILLPLMISAAAMLWSMARSLEAISASVDRQEASRAWSAVQSAVGALEERAGGMILDNARWDDAVDKVYGEADLDWIMDTWGISSSDPNYNASFVIERDGTVLAGFRDGVEADFTAAAYLGPALTRAVGDLPDTKLEFETVTTLVQTPDGIAVMAVGPVLPITEGKTVPADHPRYLVLVRTLTAPIVATISRQYIVDDLALMPIAAAPETANLLRDRWGTPIAAATWTPRHPGQAAERSYRFGALAVLATLIAMLLPISVVHWRTVAALERSERRAWQDARRDPLTDLPNRRALIEAVEGHVAGAGDGQLALMLIDLDGFKTVNDAFGHDIGDRLIRSIAAGLAALLPVGCVAHRIGGDEFAVLVGGRQAARRAETIADDILAFVREPFDLAGRHASIGASVGISVLSDPSLDAAELLRRADIAMYVAKDEGRNCVRHFDAALDRRNVDELAIAAEMRRLLEQGSFEVAYQPIVDSRSRAIVAVEALARWPKRSHMQLTPDRFIPIAEEHGLISALGRHVLHTACADMAGFGDLRLSVNVSPLQLNDRNLVADIRAVAEETGFPLDRLEVEFTESALVKNAVVARRAIDELHAAGASVALDDFGTGYASIGCLREFSFSTVKLDRSLTRDATLDTAAQKVVQGAILMAKGLSASVVAEGVECEEQARLLRLAGCELLQGYHFGRPQSAPLMTAMLNRGVTASAS